MPKKIELITGEIVSVRARCVKCDLLMISEIGDQKRSINEMTIESKRVTNPTDLLNVAFITCVHCREQW